MLPRPDVARLGIAYRRIPIMAIGRDVYLDTRLQLRKLEELPGPKPKLGSERGDDQVVERLLSIAATDGGVFRTAAALLPPTLPLLKDPAFQRDRADLMGAPFDPEALSHGRPEALRELLGVFELLETTLLADGRNWLLKTDGPGLADLEAVWPLHWMTIGMPPGHLPQDHFSPATFPKVYAWIRRFDAAVSEASAKLGKPKTLKGGEAARLVAQAPWHEAERPVDAADFVAAAVQGGIRKGDAVAVRPTDTGTSRTDTGALVSLDKDEVVFETSVEGGGSVRVHAPRHGFRVTRAKDGLPSGKL
ncbi:hypothetical protein HIM_06797 [Hirsutella minnesotensis 3608]|uniref:DUF7962 domain-containing protein n=1 Tax=Hirsutella minnesotensis 3608 TaxID=1043627 RepID=A0A0F8A4N8_9HYPO|nr:hypothetical protein HIM_06797 [Hirsutella minnesotensis 3608]